ncbi:MAG: methylenetetrahydrofolate reductase [Gaiellaceae bacterium]|jgi:methylenetetrahydrofolate reductase (NADPH)|nr:methylenetetrahydrofolate reductase [Gaiellaceae bacterium]
MRIDEIIATATEPTFSFEFFPPKSEEGEANLRATLAELATYLPSFVSITYGAGGSTRERTVELVKWMKNDLRLEAMAHLTCVGATVDELRAVLRDLRAGGIENVIALRGDAPAGETEWRAVEGGLRYGSELAKLIADEFDFCIAGACYPETHPQALSREDDLLRAKEKVDAGARVLITNLFFENRAYFDFVRAARELGIDVPIVPGIMPVTNVAQIKRISSLSGATMPAALVAALESRADRPEAVVELGVAYATLQCADLLANGAPGIHFYTLNRSPATSAIVSALRLLRPWERNMVTA